MAGIPHILSISVGMGSGEEYLVTQSEELGLNKTLLRNIPSNFLIHWAFKRTGKGCYLAKLFFWEKGFFF